MTISEGGKEKVAQAFRLIFLFDVIGIRFRRASLTLFLARRVLLHFFPLLCYCYRPLFGECLARFPSFSSRRLWQNK